MIDYKEQYASQLKWAESQGYKNIYRRAISKGLRKYKNERKRYI